MNLIGISKIMYNSLKLIVLSSLLLISTSWFCSAGSLKLIWDANTEDDLAGYKVYYGTSSGNYEQPIDVGNVTEYELKGLNEGITYYIALTAYDTSNNESEKSDEVSGVPQPPPDTQNPTIIITYPTSSSTYSTSNNTITISGTASDNKGVTSITWSNNRGGSGSATGTTSWTISKIPLFCGKDNIITVTANDDAGNSSTDNLTLDVRPCKPAGLSLK